MSGRCELCFCKNTEISEKGGLLKRWSWGLEVEPCKDWLLLDSVATRIVSAMSSFCDAYSLSYTLLLLCCLAIIHCVTAWPGAVATLAAAAAAPPASYIVPGAVGTRLGTHILLEVRDAPFAQLNSSSSVLAAMYAAISAGGLTVVGELAHQFPVQGFSAVLMIRSVEIACPLQASITYI